MTANEFNKLDPEEQWKWVIDNKEKVTQIELDNDCTYVLSPLFKEEDNEYYQGRISMKSYLGNGWGIDHLLEALGIKCAGV